ncbi:hypothetical protein HOA59_02985 [archaeon]|jgi:predicted small secreted protein|nr:hypothetical protein [archaeon]MBT6824376.1 hypothetical protein [archaeon]MBT7106926.1 hypothetical protein [archaeon]MBT7297479.1 hypothetical protein [archaeon]
MKRIIVILALLSLVITGCTQGPGDVADTTGHVDTDDFGDYVLEFDEMNSDIDLDVEFLDIELGF